MCRAAYSPWKRARNWVTSRQSDPVPAALTASGVLISLAALGMGWGWWAKPWDSTGFSVNLLADLALIGPALLLSNVIVVRVRAARARARIEPLLHQVIHVAQSSIQTAQQACDMLGVEVSLEMVPEPIGDPPELQPWTLSWLEGALSDARLALPPVTQRGNLPKQLDIDNPFEFPRFGLMLRLIRQMDDFHPMPRAISTANEADDWSDRCGVDFFYYGYIGPKTGATRDRKIGLARIHHDSFNVLKGRTDISTAGYLDLVDQCLVRVQAITMRLAQELPKSLRR
jgi:hypothetical protein